MQVPYLMESFLFDYGSGAAPRVMVVSTTKVVGDIGAENRIALHRRVGRSNHGDDRARAGRGGDVRPPAPPSATITTETRESCGGRGQASVDRRLPRVARLVFRGLARDRRRAPRDNRSRERPLSSRPAEPGTTRGRVRLSPARLSDRRHRLSRRTRTGAWALRLAGTDSSRFLSSAGDSFRRHLIIQRRAPVLLQAFTMDPGDETVTLPREEAEHLTRVLRLGVGDTVAVFDGRGHEFLARVAGAAGREVRVQLLPRVEPAAESAVALTLAQAVLKGDKMDDVIRDAVMLGVSRDSADRDQAHRGHRCRADEGRAHRSVAAHCAGVSEAVAPCRRPRDPDAADLRAPARRAAVGAAAPARRAERIGRGRARLRAAEGAGARRCDGLCRARRRLDRAGVVGRGRARRPADDAGTAHASRRRGVDPGNQRPPVHLGR